MASTSSRGVSTGPRTVRLEGIGVSASNAYFKPTTGGDPCT